MNDIFEEYIINYEYYVASIQYLDCEAGLMFFNLKKFLQIYDTRLCAKILKIIQDLHFAIVILCLYYF